MEREGEKETTGLTLQSCNDTLPVYLLLVQSVDRPKVARSSDVARFSSVILLLPPLPIPRFTGRKGRKFE